jgi:hypothetical protein
MSRGCAVASPVHWFGGMRYLVYLVMLVGCERDLVQELADAALIDAPTDAATHCSLTPAEPIAAGAHKIYLNTEGATLRTGCGDDATTNCTTLIQTDMTQVPAFLPGVAGRDTVIAQIVAGVEGVLAPYSVDIVTTRPATGPYQMIVLGGDPMAVTGGCTDCTATSVFSCQPLGSVVDLVFDLGVTKSVDQYAVQILEDIGILNGLVATNSDHDCVCRFDDMCSNFGANDLCTFGTNVPTTMQTLGTPPTPFNCGRATQDEPAILKTVLGCR